MPYRHVKVLGKEGAHSFIQGEKKKKPTAKFEIMSIILIILIIKCALVSTLETYDDPENGNYMHYINYTPCLQLNALYSLY